MVNFKKYSKMVWEDPLNVWYLVQGTVRYFFYNKAKWLLRKHIVEQYEWRTKKAKKCLENKSCLACGCKTPELFFADKPCALSKINDEFTRILVAQRKLVCYPKMMTKNKWYKGSKNKWYN